MKKSNLLLSAIFASLTALAQDTVHYTGKTLANVDYHHGQLPLAMGVHNYQVMRANREQPTAANGFGWTYNHASMIAYWNNTFYLQYLADPVGEHVPPGQTLMLISKDGRHWSAPEVVFPPYKIPDGFQKPEYKGVAKDLYAVMHQRMGFYVASNNRMLTVAYYGIAMDAKDDPNDGNGVGRVVREILPNGSYGPIYFIRFNHTFKNAATDYPLYTKSNDKGFVDACNELLSKPLMMQQWNEEADRDDPLIPLKKEYKAFCFYTLPDGKVVGLWKHALTSITSDKGLTWKYNPLRAPGFVNSNAKIWGQKTSDGKYATVYNPSEYRWPLALSVSANGLEYKNLLLVNGEVSPMRYGGNYKSYGPQYVRGILEGNGKPPDGNMWLTYSMNKEDIWVASVPVPVLDKQTGPVKDHFSTMKDDDELKYWNINSLQWAPVNIQKQGNEKALSLSDWDPYEYAKAERLFAASSKFTVEFAVTPAQHHNGLLEIELQDEKGNPSVRISFDADSLLKAKSGARYRTLQKYTANEKYTIKIDVNTATRMANISINGRVAGPHIFFAPAAELSRILFRTGSVRKTPHADTPADNSEDLPRAGSPDTKAAYLIHYLNIYN